MGGGRTASAARPRLDLRANASAALAAVLLGASVVAARVAVREVPPLSLAVLRFGQGFLLLAAAMLVLAPNGLRVAKGSPAAAGRAAQRPVRARLRRRAGRRAAGQLARPPRRG